MVTHSQEAHLQRLCNPNNLALNVTYVTECAKHDIHMLAFMQSLFKLGFWLISTGIFCQHQRVNEDRHYVLLRHMCMCVTIAIFLEVRIVLG